MSASSAIRAGRAFVELFADDSALSRGLKAARAKLQAWSGSLRSMGTGLAAIGTTAIAPLLYVTKIAGDMGETVSRFNAVFGDSAASVQQWADDYSEAVGRSKKDTLDGLSSFQSFFLGMGIGADQAQDLSKEMAGLAVDFGSFNNMQDPEAMQRFISALSGSTQVLDMFGINLRATELDLALLARGFPKSTEGATEMQKVMGRMDVIKKAMGAQGAVGDAIKTSNSFANTVKGLKGKLTDLAVAVGNALIPPLTNLMNVSKNIINTIATWISANEGLAQMVLYAAGGVVALGVAMLTLSGGLSIASFAVGGLITVISGVGAVFAALLTPIGAVVAAVAGLGAYFLTSTDSGREMVDNLSSGWDSLTSTTLDAVGAMGDAIAAGDIQTAGNVLWSGLNLLWTKGTNFLTSVWESMTGGLGDAMFAAQNWIAKALVKSWGTLQAIWVTTTDALKNAWDTFCNYALQFWFYIVDQVAGAWDMFLALFDSSVDAVENAKKRTIEREAATKQRDQELEQTKRNRDKEQGQTLYKINKNELDQVKELENMKTRREEARLKQKEESEKAAQDAADAAKNEFAAAVGKAKQVGADYRAKQEEKKKADIDKAKKIEKVVPVETQKQILSGVSGTFSAAIAARMTDASVAGQQLEELQKANENLAGIKDAIKDQDRAIME
jgi:hypothetical protein